MNSPSLSVVMPNYNHGRFLAQSLAAIVSQLRAMDELIVIDDASSDNSREIITDFASRHGNIRPVFLEKNCGVVPNLNRGLAMASGDYVCFAAADDYVLPGFVEAAMYAAIRYPQAGIIACDPGYHAFGADTYEMFPLRLAKEQHYFSPEAVVTIGKVIEAGIGMTTHASIVRRAALAEAGGFDPALEFCCDWFTMYVIAFRQGFVYVPHEGAVMRVDPKTYSGVGWSSRERKYRVLRNLVQMIVGQRHQDVRDAFVQSGVLRHFQPDILWLAVRDDDVRSLMRVGDIWFGLKHMLRWLQINQLVPERVKAIRRRRANLRAQRALNIDS